MSRSVVGAPWSPYTIKAITLDSLLMFIAVVIRRLHTYLSVVAGNVKQVQATHLPAFSISLSQGSNVHLARSQSSLISFQSHFASPVKRGSTQSCLPCCIDKVVQTPAHRMLFAVNFLVVTCAGSTSLMTQKHASCVLTCSSFNLHI